MEKNYYTKSEIDLMNKPINEKLNKILMQTTRHNSRMDKLEQWKSYITGGMAIIAVIIIPVLLLTLSKL